MIAFLHIKRQGYYHIVVRPIYDFCLNIGVSGPLSKILKLRMTSSKNADMIAFLQNFFASSKSQVNYLMKISKIRGNPYMITLYLQASPFYTSIFRQGGAFSSEQAPSFAKHIHTYIYIYKYSSCISRCLAGSPCTCSQ